MAKDFDMMNLFVEIVVVAAAVADDDHEEKHDLEILSTMSTNHYCWLTRNRKTRIRQITEHRGNKRERKIVHLLIDIDHLQLILMKYRRDQLLVQLMNEFEVHSYIVHVYAIWRVDFETKPEEHHLIIYLSLTQ